MSNEVARPQPGTRVSHTPGPWWLDDRRPGGALQIQAKHRGEGSSYCVATVNFWEAPEANARLIAAAPDMLKALKHAEATLRILSEEIASLLSGAAKSCARDAAECRAAIAKATSPSASIGGE